jgi:hypothetical protein
MMDLTSKRLLKDLRKRLKVVRYNLCALKLNVSTSIGLMWKNGNSLGYLMWLEKSKMPYFDSTLSLTKFDNYI